MPGLLDGLPTSLGMWGPHPVGKSRRPKSAKIRRMVKRVKMAVQIREGLQSQLGGPPSCLFRPYLADTREPESRCKRQKVRSGAAIPCIKLSFSLKPEPE